jgi:hypothetical protein
VAPEGIPAEFGRSEFGAIVFDAFSLAFLICVFHVVDFDNVDADSDTPTPMAVVRPATVPLGLVVIRAALPALDPLTSTLVVDSGAVDEGIRVANLPREVPTRRLRVGTCRAEAVSDPVLRAALARAAMACPPDAKRARDGTPRTPEGGKNTERTRVRQTCHTIWADQDARLPVLFALRPPRVIDDPYPPVSAFNPAVSRIGPWRERGLPGTGKFLRLPYRAVPVPAPQDRPVGHRR